MTLCDPVVCSPPGSSVHGILQARIERGWDGWMASLTQWTWVWVNSRSWWWTGRPGVMQSIGLQRVGHDWATELIDWLTDWGKNTRVGYHFLFQWIFSTQGLNLTLLPCSWILYYWDTREALTSLFIFSIVLHEWNYPLCTLPVHFLSLL